MQDAPVQHCQLQRMKHMLLRGLAIKKLLACAMRYASTIAVLQVLLTYPL